RMLVSEMRRPSRMMRSLFSFSIPTSFLRDAVKLPPTSGWKIARALAISVSSASSFSLVIWRRRFFSSPSSTASSSASESVSRGALFTWGSEVRTGAAAAARRESSVATHGGSEAIESGVGGRGSCERRRTPSGGTRRDLERIIRCGPLLAAAARSFLDDLRLRRHRHRRAEQGEGVPRAIYLAHAALELRLTRPPLLRRLDADLARLEDT